MRTTDSSQKIYAQQIVELFSGEYVPELVSFACHAALPVVLNAEFLHLIRINFFLDVLPYTAEAKLLHSPICEGRGNDVYEIQSDVRNILLQKLIEECGDDRLHQVAGLLWHYLDQRSPWEDHIRLKRAQQLTALNFLNPEKAQQWLAEAEEILNFQDTELRAWFVAIRKEIEQQKLAIQPYRLNRLISEQEIARIKEDYEQAAHYQHSDPLACLSSSRRLAEDICKQLVARELAEDARGLMLHKLINKLSNDKVLPYYIEAPLRTIQYYGNLGAHPQEKDAGKITPEYVKPCIQSLSKIVDWYINTYQPEEITSDWQQNEQVGETFDEYAFIKREFEKVLVYQYSDPMNCLFTSRRIAEDICKQLVARELAEDARGLMLHKLINKLSNYKILPYYIEAPLRAIQSYGILGAHPQGKDVEKITPEYVQPCVQGLAVVVDWYLHTYRPVKAVVFTARKADWRQIEPAQRQLKPTLNIVFSEPKNDMDADELLERCQAAADALQSIPSIFLFPQDAPQHIRETVSEAGGKAFKAWGNRVFSVLLPEEIDTADIQTFDKLFTILETILHIQSQTPIERQRRIDAAAPEASEINQHVDLLVQIRFRHSPILEIEQWPARQTPQAIPILGIEQWLARQTLKAIESASGEISVKFPVDKQTGTIQAAYLQIKVIAPDYIMHSEPEKRIEIPPEEFSPVIKFLLTPKKEGSCRIQIEVYNDERTYLGTVAVNMLVVAARNESFLQ